MEAHWRGTQGGGGPKSSRGGRRGGTGGTTAVRADDWGAWDAAWKRNGCNIELPGASLTVAVFFGTFDPIHENHVGLAKFALREGYADRVVFVPNGDTSMKPGAAPWETRRRIVAARLRAEDDGRLCCLALGPEERSRMDWAGRRRILARVRAEAEAAGLARRVEVVQMMGQDSFENSVLRKETSSRAGNGIFGISHRLLVFPRGGQCQSRVQVPPGLRGKVTVMEGYADPTVISSTAVRAALRAEGAESVDARALQDMVHATLHTDLRHAYDPGCATEAPDGAAPRRIRVLLMGGPGSGKTTVGKSLRELGVCHMSGGDIYRALAEQASRGGNHLGASQQLVARVLAIMAQQSQDLGGELFSFDGVLPRDLKDFESKVGQIDLIINFLCGAETLERRLRQRGARGEADGDAEQRVRRFVQPKQRALDARLLSSFDAGRGLVRDVDAEQPLEVVCQQCSDLVRAAAAARRVVSGTGAGARDLDEAFWTRAVAEVETDPRRSYNARLNPTRLTERGGSRALKNSNNLVKTVLIDWAFGQISTWLGGAWVAEGLAVEVLDVASGRGGDQLKFALAAQSARLRIGYSAVDVAEGQVAEAVSRLREARRRGCGDTAADPVCALRAARYFVGDVSWAASLPSHLPWLQLVSAQFALHYAFGSVQAARGFLSNALARLCTGGLLILTTLDADQLAKLAQEALVGELSGRNGALVAENPLFRVSFADPGTAHQVMSGAAEFGLRYHFALSADGISCEEFVVPQTLLQQLLAELDVHLLAAIPFSSLLPAAGAARGGSARALADAVLAALGGLGTTVGGDYGVYGARLGIDMDAGEAEVFGLYKAYVCWRGPQDATEAVPGHWRPSVLDCLLAARQTSHRGDPREQGCPGDVLQGGAPLHLPEVPLIPKQLTGTQLTRPTL